MHNLYYATFVSIQKKYPKKINEYPKRINGYPKRIKRIKWISEKDTKRILNIRKGYKKDKKYPKRIQKG
jgi:hypothetical protein